MCGDADGGDDCCWDCFMSRIRLTIEYDGTNYAGWQRQDNAVTVQQRVEEALERLTGVKTVVTGASRTDAGVHASGQTAHFDTSSHIPPEKFAFALNTMLPEDIRVRSSELTRYDFHARFDAKGKIYRYMIYSSPHASALRRLSYEHIYYPLDICAMNEEASSMIGRHDFKAFAASGSAARDTIRRIDACSVAGWGDEVMILIMGGGFLYNMVRILAGTLIQVGCGKLESGAISRAIRGKSRLDLGVTAPAKGLTLMRVFYEDDIHLANCEFDGILNDFLHLQSASGMALQK